MLQRGNPCLTVPAAGFMAQERLGRRSHAERGNDQNPGGERGCADSQGRQRGRRRRREGQPHHGGAAPARRLPAAHRPGRAGAQDQDPKAHVAAGGGFGEAGTGVFLKL